MDKQNPQRETYLDIIKGIAMLLVVMQHVGGRIDTGITFICKTDVPLFFIVSGYLAYKPSINYRDGLIKKIKRILVPFLAASVFAVFYYGISFQEFIFNIGKCGYWFLESLFIIFVLFYILHKIVSLFPNRICGYALIASTVFIELWLLALSKYGTETIDNVIGVSYLSRYFPCFMAGTIIRKCSVQQIGKLSGSILLVATCVAFTYNGINTNVSFLLHVAGYVCAALFLFYFIKCIENEIPLPIRNLFCMIGRNSLSIYIIHFYFVQYLTLSTGYFAIDFAIVLGISLIIIFLSVIVQKILLKMTYLYKIL